MPSVRDSAQGAHDNHFELALRVVAGDLPPTSDIPFDHPDSRVPGQLDKRVLLQTQQWVDRLGHVNRLEDMGPTYRANVLLFLRAQAPEWVADAAAWEITAAITGIISARDASYRLELLDLLTPGWTDHTPLGSRLHDLNDSRAQRLAPPQMHLGAADSDHPDILRDDDGGQWQVSTRSGTAYLIDLDRRRIQRQPGPTSPTNGDGPRAPVSSLPFDGQWTDLDCLMRCRTGDPLIVLDQRPGTDGRGGYRISTAVVDITRVDGSAPATEPENE